MGETRSSRRNETAPLLLREPQIPHVNQASINTTTRANGNLRRIFCSNYDQIKKSTSDIRGLNSSRQTVRPTDWNSSEYTWCLANMSTINVILFRNHMKPELVTNSFPDAGQLNGRHCSTSLAGCKILGPFTLHYILLGSPSPHSVATWQRWSK